MAIPTTIILENQQITQLAASGYLKLNDVTIYQIGKQYYVVDQENGYISRGAFGSLHKAFPLNLATGKVDLSHTVALKVCDPVQNDLEDVVKEQAMLARYFKDVSKVGYINIPSDDSENPAKNYYAFTMEYFAANPLATLDEHGNLQINPEIANLSLIDRIQAILQLSLFLSLLHHQSPSCDAVIVHRDIKPQNILLSIETVNNQKTVMAVPVDFGFAIPIASDNLAKIRYAKFTKLTAAPEVFKGEIGAKSDIYAFASVVLMLLGVTDPFAGLKDSRQGQYNLTGLLDNIAVPGDSAFIKNLIKQFIEQLCDKDYQARPNIDTTLAFFTALHHYCLLYKNSDKPDPELLAINTAKMIVLAENPADICYEKIDFSNNPQHCMAITYLTKNSDKENRPLSFKTIFNSNLTKTSCDKISALYQQEKLTRKIICDAYSPAAPAKPAALSALSQLSFLAPTSEQDLLEYIDTYSSLNFYR